MSNPEGSRGGKQTYDADLEEMRQLIARRCRPDENGCLIWDGYCLKGYPQTHIRRKSRLVHRVLYFVERGPIPEEMQIDHICNQTKCLNIEHLQLTTAKENTLRSSNPCALHYRKEFCSKGHEFDKVITRGGRTCRACSTCERKWKRESKKRLRERKENDFTQLSM